MIIGTDVIYEPLHAELVANVVARRLQPGGVCLLCCGVRIQVRRSAHLHTPFPPEIKACLALSSQVPNVYLCEDSRPGKMGDPLAQ